MLTSYHGEEEADDDDDDDDWSRSVMANDN